MHSSGVSPGPALIAPILIWSVFWLFLGGRAIKKLCNPGYSKIAAVSSICLAGVYVGSGILTLLKELFPDQPPLVFGLLGIFVLVLIVGTGVVALVALSLLYGMPKPTRLRGLRAAWINLSLVVLMVGFGVTAAVKAYSQRFGTSGQAEEISCSAYNYAVTRPAGWGALDAKKFSPVAETFLRDRTGQIGFEIIPELVGESSLNPDQIAEVVKSNLRSSSRDQENWEQGTRVRSGLEWTLVRVDSTVGNSRVRYVVYAVCKGGMSYELCTWGPLRQKNDVEAAAETFLNSFRLLDPVKTAANIPGIGDYRSAKFDYTVRLSDSHWKAYANLAKDYPAAEFGAIGVPDRGLLVVPMQTGRLRPEMEPLLYALLKKVGASSENFEVLEKRTPAWGSEWVLNGTRDVTKTKFQYVCRVVSNPPLAFLVAAWSADQSEDTRRLLLRDTDRVTLPELPPAKVAVPDNREFALFVNDVGCYYFANNQIERSAECFQAAMDADSANEPILQNLCDAYLELRQVPRGLKLLALRNEMVEQSGRLLAVRARLQAAADSPEEAMDSWRKAFELKLSSTSALLSFAGFATEAQSDSMAKEAKRLIEPYVNSKEPDALGKAYVRLLQRTDGLDQALGYLESRPWHDQAEIALAKIELLYAAKQYSRGLEVCDKMTEEHPTAWKFWAWRGQNLAMLQRMREARSAFEHAVELNPLDQQSRKAAADLSAMLGQGDNASVREPLAAVVLPDATKALLESKLPEQADGADAIYSARIRACAFEPGKPMRNTHYSRVKVFTPAGVDAFSSIEVRFDSFREKVFLNQLKVFAPDGSLVANGDADSCFVTRHATDRTASNASTLTIPVPGLRPGGSFLLVTTQEELGASEKIDFSRYTFAAYYPVQNDVFVLRAEPRDFSSKLSAGVTAESQDGYSVWKVTNSPAVRLEPGMPEMDSLFPTVVIGPKSGSWKEVGERYTSQIASRLAPDLAIKQKAAEFKKAGKTDSDLLSEIVRFTQQNVSYTAIEFGIRGRIPEPASKVMENRYGDCKDHATLLHSLLTAAGIEAHLALVSTSGAISEEIPSLDQFNHMVVYVPSAPSKFVDCTDKDGDPVALPPQEILGKRALILGKDPKFVTVELPEKTESALRLTRKIVEQDAGRLLVQEQAQFTGYLAADIRRYLRSSPQADRTRDLEKYLSARNVRVTLEKLEHSELTESSGPVRLTLDYSLKAPGGDAGEHAIFLPWIWERSYLPNWTGERKNPMEWKFPVRVLTEISWRGKDQNKLGNIPRPTQQVVQWKIAAERANEAQTLKCEVKVAAGRYDPKVVRSIEDETDSLFRFLEHPVLHAGG